MPALVEVPFPKTQLPIAMRGSLDQYSIIGFFGPNHAYSSLQGYNNAPRSLSEYVRGGVFVPNGPVANASLPSSAPIKESDLLSRVAYLGITWIGPGGLYSNELPAFNVEEVTFVIGSNVHLTHHSYMWAEKRWSYTWYIYNNWGSGQPINLSDPSQTVFSQDDVFKIKFQQPHNETLTIRIDVLLEVRSLLTGAIASASTDLHFRFHYQENGNF